MEKSRKDLIQEISLNALIAALYVVLTVVISPLSYGAIQFRFSEILILFCFFNKRYSIGLTLGCLIANCFSPTAPLDIPFGTIATLLACVCIMFSKHLLLAIIFPVIFNGFIIAWELAIMVQEPYWMSVLTIGAGELAVMVIGYILFTGLRRSKVFLRAIKANQNLSSRSFMSHLAEIYLRITRTSYPKFVKTMEEKLNKEDEKWLMPKYISDDISEEEYQGMRVYYVNKNKEYSKVFFYIHGGYYAHEAISFQIKMLKKIIDKNDVLLIYPVYPLAPNYTVEDSFEIMKSLFKKAQKDYQDKKIILAGDSAGGGYSLALAESLDKQPDELILISPWVDITLGNPDIKNYIKKDPRIIVEKGVYAGEKWRGQVDANDYRVSPINGDLAKLNNVTVFVGTRELFLPDSTLLYEKMKERDVACELIVAEGQNHVYPAYPTREGRFAIKQIREIIKRNPSRN